MLRLISCVVAFITLTHAQPPVVPLGSTAATLPSALPPTLPPGNPNLYPYGQRPRPGYNDLYNDRYYNPTGGPAVPILTYSNEHNGDGSYSFSFSTADGKQAQETGFVKDSYIDNAGEPQGTQVVQGSYSYVSPEGTPIQVNYVADENGFRPSGVHISADGRGIAPLPIPPSIVDGKNNAYDPLYNRYDPSHHRYDPLRNRYDQLNRYPLNDRYPLNGRYPFNGRYPLNDRYPLNNDRYDPLRNRYDPRYPLNNDRYPLNNDRYPLNNDRYDPLRNRYDHLNRYPLNNDRYPFNNDRYPLGDPLNRYNPPSPFVPLQASKDAKDQKKESA